VPAAQKYTEVSRARKARAEEMNFCLQIPRKISEISPPVPNLGEETVEAHSRPSCPNRIRSFLLGGEWGGEGGKGAKDPVRLLKD